MTETLTHGYSSDTTLREFSNEYQHDRVLKNVLHSCAFDESSLSIKRVNLSKTIFTPGKDRVEFLGILIGIVIE